MVQEGVCIGVTAHDRKQVIEILAALQQKCGAVKDYRPLMNAVLEQEKQKSSAIGSGVSIAEICCSDVEKPSLTAVTLKRGVDYASSDGSLVRLAFLAVVPKGEPREEGSRISVLLMDEDLREQLMGAVDEETFLTFWKKAEEGGGFSQREMPLILAVIDEKHEDASKAAATLQQTAGKRGYLLRVEFDEKGKPELGFSFEELQEADGVLLMSGARTDIFDGKPILRAGVSDGVYRPEHLLNHVTSAPVYHKKTPSKGRGFWRRMRKNRKK